MKKIFITLLTIGLSIQLGFGQESEQPKIRKAQEEQVNIKIKNNAHPDIYIDGIKYDSKIFSLLDHSKVEAIEVVKNERAIKEYNAPNGVILITTKDAESAQIQLRQSNKVEIISKNNEDEDQAYPLVIIDGKKSTKQTLAELNPKNIKSLNIIGGTEAKKKYGTEDKVIIVTTKE